MTLRGKIEEKILFLFYFPLYNVQFAKLLSTNTHPCHPIDAPSRGHIEKQVWIILSFSSVNGTAIDLHI